MRTTAAMILFMVTVMGLAMAQKRVVFYDPTYETSWVDNPEAAARFYELRGFTVLDAEKAGRWMERRVEERVPGTVLVSVMGTCPSSMVPEEIIKKPREPAVPDCRLTRYLRAGGRVVWFSNIPMYTWQGPYGPLRTLDGRTRVLGIRRNKEYYYGSPGPAEITDAGHQWGVEGAWSPVRPVPAQEVTISFVDDAKLDLSAVWLKNFNPEYPLSGFISIPPYLHAKKDTQLLEDGYRLALYDGDVAKVPDVPAEAAEPPEIEVRVEPYADDALPRQAYTRSETAPVRVRVTNNTDAPRAVAVELWLKDGEKTLQRWEGAISVTAEGEGEFRADVSLESLRSAEYQLRANASIRGEQQRGDASLWVCPRPPTDGLYMAFTGRSPTIRRRLDWYLERCRELGMTGLLVSHPSAEILDRCLWYEMPLTARLHGHPAVLGFEAPEKELYRLNASGEPFPNPWEGERRTLTGIANVDWQKAWAESMGRQVAAIGSHPGSLPVISTCDDFSARAGLDYNAANVERFRENYGFEPPRPEELMDRDKQGKIDRETGIIPDDDPWLVWQRFLSRDVLGGFAERLSEAVSKATGGRGRIGPIPGGMQIPLVNMWSGQWPPYNFGEDGFSIILSYNYNFYWVPALGQVWWYELGRMGNRDMEQWLWPDCMRDEMAYHVNNWFLFMASGLDGLVYFTYGRLSDGAEAAFEYLKPLPRTHGKLLAALEPVPRTVGLLMPLENGAFRPGIHIQTAYAFCNLAMAHAEVEPVWPEELPEIGDRYEVICLHDVDYLTESNLAILQQYMRQGGTVICDSACDIEIPDAEVLQFLWEKGSRRQGYGKLDRIARVKRAIEAHVVPWARADDPHFFVRRFHQGGVDYLWVVHLMDHEQDILHDKFIHEDSDLAALDERAGFGEKTVEATITVPAADVAVHDALEGKPIACSTENGRLAIPVEFGVWEGTLLALYPQRPRAVWIEAAEKAERGETVWFDITVEGAGELIDADMPLEIVVRGPTGERNREYSHEALAKGGRYQFEIPFATNDRTGRWRVTARAVSVELWASSTLELR